MKLILMVLVIGDKNGAIVRIEKVVKGQLLFFLIEC